MTIPTPSARFRPRADADLLASLAREAREALAASLNAEIDGGVCETITTWLADRHPTAEMEVLARWGYAKEADSITVWAHGEMFGIKLSRPLLLPENRRSVTACGRRFSEEEGYGLNPDYLATLTAEGGLEKYLADHRATEADLLPKSVDPLFLRLVDARKAFEAMRVSLTHFSQAKTDDRYPTWDEIEAAFPVFGDYVATRRLEAGGA